MESASAELAAITVLSAVGTTKAGATLDRNLSGRGHFSNS